MSKADKQIKELYKNIMENGYKREDSRMYWKDGEKALYKSVIGQQLVFEPDEIPIVTSKFVPVKSACVEMLWIWANRSNRVQDLRELGSPVWNEWELEDGTIGKSYGYQMESRKYVIDTKNISEKSFIALGKDKEETYVNFLKDSDKTELNQTQYVIQQLIDNPYNRQIVTSLWNIDDLPEMSLQPCVWTTQWLVADNKVNLIVQARSSDCGLGILFNILQYAVLQRLICHITGWEIGNLIFRTGDAHLYDRHEPLAEQFINNPEYEAPEFWISDDLQTLEDAEFNKNFGFKNYKKDVGNAGFIRSEVCVTKAELERLL